LGLNLEQIVAAHTARLDEGLSLIPSSDLLILKDALYHYRETIRLGGDELHVLQRIVRALGGTEEEVQKIRG
jgi:hypothetical protein